MKHFNGRRQRNCYFHLQLRRTTEHFCKLDCHTSQNFLKELHFPQISLAIFDSLLCFESTLFLMHSTNSQVRYYYNHMCTLEDLRGADSNHHNSSQPKTYRHMMNTEKKYHSLSYFLCTYMLVYPLTVVLGPSLWYFYCDSLTMLDQRRS